MTLRTNRFQTFSKEEPYSPQIPPKPEINQESPFIRLTNNFGIHREVLQRVIQGNHSYIRAIREWIAFNNIGQVTQNYQPGINQVNPSRRRPISRDQSLDDELKRNLNFVRQDINLRLQTIGIPSQAQQIMLETASGADFINNYFSGLFYTRSGSTRDFPAQFIGQMREPRSNWRTTLSAIPTQNFFNELPTTRSINNIQRFYEPGAEAIHIHRQYNLQTEDSLAVLNPSSFHAAIQQLRLSRIETSYLISRYHEYAQFNAAEAQFFLVDLPNYIEEQGPFAFSKQINMSSIAATSLDRNQNQYIFNPEEVGHLNIDTTEDGKQRYTNLRHSFLSPVDVNAANKISEATLSLHSDRITSFEEFTAIFKALILQQIITSSRIIHNLPPESRNQTINKKSLHIYSLLKTIQSLINHPFLLETEDNLITHHSTANQYHLVRDFYFYTISYQLFIMELDQFMRFIQTTIHASHQESFNLIGQNIR